MEKNMNIIEFKFENGAFTLEEFDARIEREIRGIRAALIAYGDVFKVGAVKQSTPTERGDEAFAKKHDIYLTGNNIRCKDNSSFCLTITALNELRFEGVTELNITYDSGRCTFKAVIPMSDIDTRQKSISITMIASWLGDTYGYHPNTNTKWGSYFYKV